MQGKPSTADTVQFFSQQNGRSGFIGLIRRTEVYRRPSGVIDGIIEQSGTPYLCFTDLDENKPSGSIKIRVETIDYFLRRSRDEVIRKRKATEDVEARLAALEAELRGSVPPQPLPCQSEVQEMAAD